MNLNPMFQQRPDETKTSHNGRKKRSDRLIDIKVPLEKEQLKAVLIQAYSSHSSPTSWASNLVREGLSTSYIQYAPGASYKDTKQYIHVKLRREEHEQVLMLAVEWGLRSIRRATHRILINLLEERIGANL